MLIQGSGRRLTKTSFHKRKTTRLERFSVEETRIIVLQLCKEEQPTWKIANRLGVCYGLQTTDRAIIKNLMEEEYLVCHRERTSGFVMSPPPTMYHTTSKGLNFLSEAILIKEPEFDPRPILDISPEVTPVRKGTSRCSCGTFKKWEAPICKKCQDRAERTSTQLMMEFEKHGGVLVGDEPKKAC